ncbi:MAG: hypothetical protein ACTSQY_02240 [Candidatus Odinarchaeia archaeon]
MGSELYFYCDLCNKQFKEKMGGGVLGDIAKSVMADIAGSVAGWQARKAVYSLGRHDLPDQIMDIVSTQLNYCSSCGRWVCGSCWEPSKNVCKSCSNTFTGSPATAPLFEPEPQPVQEQSQPITSGSSSTSSQPPAPLPLSSQPVPLNIPTIVCPYCGKPTIPGPNCGQCGRPLLIECKKCGSMVPAQKFCMSCGAPLM